MSQSTYRPQRQREYEQHLVELRKRHPWLTSQVIEPAPGHWNLVEKFLEQIECLLPKTALRQSGLFCISTNRDRLVVHYQQSQRDDTRAHAILDLIAQTKYRALQQCPVCGAPVVSNGELPQRCARHEGALGLFAEEFRQGRGIPADEGIQDVLRDFGKFRPEDLRAVVDDNADPVELIVELPPVKPDTSSTPSIDFLNSANLQMFVDRHRAKGDDKLKRAQSISDRVRHAGHERRQLGLLPRIGRCS